MIKEKGILSRFVDIMKANINTLLDKAEDPEKIIDQTMNNLSKDLACVKVETAKVLAAEKMSKRDVDQCKEEIANMRQYAIKAAKKGNDEDAARFLQQKAKLEITLNGLISTYELAHDNAIKIRSMHDKLVSDMEILELRRRTIKGITSVSKAQKSINRANNKIYGISSGISTFDRMENKAYTNLYISQSETELLDTENTDSIKGLSSKYDAILDSDIINELDQIKAEIGINTNTSACCTNN